MNGRVDRLHKILDVDRFLAASGAGARGRAAGGTLIVVLALASIRFASERHCSGIHHLSNIQRKKQKQIHERNVRKRIEPKSS
jgi:hypothetical protein